MNHAEIAEGITKTEVGQLLQVKWKYHSDQLPNSPVFEWVGRLLKKNANGTAEIFYWPQQGLTIEMLNGSPGLEVTMPRDGVVYDNINWTYATAACSEDIFVAQMKAGSLNRPVDGQQHEGNGQEREGLDGSTGWHIADVTTWIGLLQSPLGVELCITKIALLNDVSESSSPHRRMAMGTLEQWIRSAATLAEWSDSPTFVAMGQGLVRNLRQTMYEETRKVNQYDIAAQMKDVEYQLDPLGKAIAELETSKKKSSFQFRKCDKCGR